MVVTRPRNPMALWPRLPSRFLECGGERWRRTRVVLLKQTGCLAELLCPDAVVQLDGREVVEAVYDPILESVLLRERERSEPVEWRAGVSVFEFESHTTPALENLDVVRHFPAAEDVVLVTRVIGTNVQVIDLADILGARVEFLREEVVSRTPEIRHQLHQVVEGHEFVAAPTHINHVPLAFMHEQVCGVDTRLVLDDDDGRAFIEAQSSARCHELHVAAEAASTGSAAA